MLAPDSALIRYGLKEEAAFDIRKRIPSSENYVPITVAAINYVGQANNTLETPTWRTLRLIQDGGR